MFWKARSCRAVTLAAALMALLVPSPPAMAQSAPSDAAVVSARVLPGWETGAGTRMGALHLTLAPGWKTYWRSPGDAGIPPSFDWTGSRNLSGVTVHWPRPQVFRINGMRSIGYAGEVVLPLEIAATRPGAPVVLEGEVSMGICEEICVPVSLRVSARLEGAGAPDQAISGALASRPRAGTARVTCVLEPIRDGMAIDLSIPMPRLRGGETVVVEPADTRIWVSEPQAHRSGGVLEARAELVPPQARPFALDRSGLRVTVIGDDDAVEMRGCTGG